MIFQLFGNFALQIGPQRLAQVGGIVRVIAALLNFERLLFVVGDQAREDGVQARQNIALHLAALLIGVKLRQFERLLRQLGQPFQLGRGHVSRRRRGFGQQIGHVGRRLAVLIQGHREDLFALVVGPIADVKIELDQVAPAVLAGAVRQFTTGQRQFARQARRGQLREMAGQSLARQRAVVSHVGHHPVEDPAAISHQVMVGRQLGGREDQAEGRFAKMSGQVWRQLHRHGAAVGLNGGAKQTKKFQRHLTLG